MKFLLRKNGIEFYYTDKFMYGKKDGELYKLALFDRHFYKLKLYNRVPVLEIDGLRMQLVKDFKTPLDYSKEVASRLKITKNDTVLDICTGLGYTAIAASKFGNKVITCELSESVLQLAKWNPFSSELFSSNIEIKTGDAFSTVKGFKDKTFDVIIHDPPRFSHAPDLYASQFYSELYRVVKTKGRLFHYVGTLGKEKGRKIEDEVKRRLELAGFRDFQYVAKLQGWFFRK